MPINPIKCQLQVERIETNHGFSIVQTNIINIPISFNYSIHIIDLPQIYKTLQEIDTFTSELNDTYLVSILKLEIQKLNDKLITLNINTHSRQKRGLINLIGTINKWIGGTMDDEDRQLINEHCIITDTNNHNIIENTNQQIHINTNFNESISKLRDNIISDRITFKEMN